MKPLNFSIAAAVVFAVAGPAAAQAAYCHGASDKLAAYMTVGRGGPPDLQSIFRDCAPGDTIALKDTFGSFAAELCDFTKSIAATSPGNVVCVFAGQRTKR